MPLAYKKDIGQDTTLGIWEFDGEEPNADSCPQQVRTMMAKQCRTRQTETFAVYSLLNDMTGCNTLTIEHEKSGRPFLKDTLGEQANLPNIGISHTNGFASIIMSRTRNVAIDIEYICNRICRIAERFLRNDERESIAKVCKCHADNDEYTRCLLIYWCAKETIYKYYSDSRLTFEHIKVELHNNTTHHGTVRCTNMLNQESKTVEYTVAEKYVITYCE